VGAGAGAGAEEPRFHDARPVDDEQVVRIAERGQLGEPVVRDRSRRAAAHHEPARVTPLERRLRDQLRREMEVVVSGEEALWHHDKLTGARTATEASHDVPFAARIWLDGRAWLHTL